MNPLLSLGFRVWEVTKVMSTYTLRFNLVEFHVLGCRVQGRFVISGYRVSGRGAKPR